MGQRTRLRGGGVVTEDRDCDDGMATGFGNDVACDNCGNEWGQMYRNLDEPPTTLCQECWEIVIADL